MSNKTPPLVIPVVVDATGVSKGLSNVNDRLRRGVSNGGGSGEGSFGSGGDMATGVAAAAVGYGVVSSIASGRGSPALTPRSTAPRHIKLANYHRMSGRAERWASTLTSSPGLAANWAIQIGGPMARIDPEDSNGAGFDPVEAMYSPGMRNARAMRFSQREARRAVWTRGQKIFGKMSTQVRRRKVDMMERMSRRGAALGAAYGSAVSGLESSLSSLVPYLGDMGAGSLGAGIGGIGGFQAARTAVNFTRNFSTNINQIDNLRGSPMYGRQRQAALRNYSSGPQPSVFQAFVGGSLLASGGRKTLLESHTQTANRQVNTTISALGAFYEGAGGFTPAQWLVHAILGRSNSN